MKDESGEGGRAGTNRLGWECSEKFAREAGHSCEGEGANWRCQSSGLQTTA